MEMNKLLRYALIVIGIMVLTVGALATGAYLAYRTNLNMAIIQQPSGQYYGLMDRGNGMGMRGWNGGSGSAGTQLSLDQAYAQAGKYLSTLNDTDLKIAEVMVFSNNAYVRVIEQSTGINAFELLVYPGSQNVSPEPGPNKMWNLKYGMMRRGGLMLGGGGGGMMGGGGGGGMMGGGSNSVGSPSGSVSAAMTISSTQALALAQQFLDNALPGTTTASDADAFYGYYTLDFLRDGKIVGMLSVNGFSGQVFLHTWHGTFIETKDY
jgi:hypothetical protein